MIMLINAGCLKSIRNFFFHQYLSFVFKKVAFTNFIFHHNEKCILPFFFPEFVIMLM